MAKKKNYHSEFSSKKQVESNKDSQNELCDKKVKTFIPNAVNPNNGAAFETYSNPLSSKGN